MKKHQEVEVKYPLYNSEDVLKSIEIINAKKILNNEHQVDAYFTPYHKNFLDNEIISEWLRIRESDKKCSVNFKRWLPIGEKIQTHCDEFEVSISDVKTMELIFKALDIREIIRVEKTRNSWILNGIEISIDFIEKLGYFIELEAIHEVEEEKIPIVYEKFKNILTQLNADIGKQDRRGYPYLLIDLNKGDK